MNDHLAVLIYLTAARLRQQRLQAGTAGGLKFRPESHALMRREGRAEPGPICATTLYSISAVSQSTLRAITVSGCLTSCLLLSLLSISIHRLTATTNRLQLQGGQGWGAAVSWSSPWSTSPGNGSPGIHTLVTRQWQVTLTTELLQLQMTFSDGQSEFFSPNVHRYLISWFYGAREIREN